MFKVEFTIDGVLKSKRFMNKPEHDFLQFVPKILSKENGVEITKENLTIFYFTDEQVKQLREKELSNKRNYINFDKSGKVSIIRKQQALVNAEDIITKDNFDDKVARRLDAVNGAQKSIAEIEQLEVITYDFGQENGGEQQAVEIPEGHELTKAYESLEMELQGSVFDWPYDENGKFQKPV